MDTETEILVRKKFDLLEPIFDEQTRRLWAATEAQVHGYRGVSVVARATGLSRTTIHQGMKDIETLREQKTLEKGKRIRASGGGRKPISDHDSTLLSGVNYPGRVTTITLAGFCEKFLIIFSSSVFFDNCPRLIQ